MLNNEFIYKIGDETIIDEIHELWSELNQIHLEKSPHFKQHFKTFTFHDRKQSLLSHANKGKLLIILAYDNDTKIGYCASSIVDNIGEIESMYVKPDYRKKHVGTMFMEKSLEWIRSNDAKEIIVKVATGNKEVFEFYSKYGFKPRLTLLQLTSH